MLVIAAINIQRCQLISNGSSVCVWMFPDIFSMLGTKWVTKEAFLFVAVTNILWFVGRKQYGGVWPTYSNRSVRKPHRKLKSCESCSDAVHSYVTLHARERSSLCCYWKHWFNRGRECRSPACRNLNSQLQNSTYSSVCVCVWERTLDGTSPVHPFLTPDMHYCSSDSFSITTQVSQQRGTLPAVYF